jgi:hypothetical protein
MMGTMRAPIKALAYSMVEVGKFDPNIAEGC